MAKFVKQINFHETMNKKKCCVFYDPFGIPHSTTPHC